LRYLLRGWGNRSNRLICLKSEVTKLKKLLVAAAMAVSLGVGSLAAASPASAESLARFCWHHPRAPICHPHHFWQWRHGHRYWW
jgi:hypothetical protein